MKKCFKCGIEKTLDNFYRHSQMGDGYLNKCKTCNKLDVKENYTLRREKYAEYERKRYSDPTRRAKHLEYQRKRRASNPIKEKARRAVANALRKGEMEKSICRCGASKVEAHHEDYLKPLDVVWLCRACHLKEHGKVAYSAKAN